LTLEKELRSFDLLVVFVGGPLIEEALKPAGVYVLLLRWPQALLGRLHTAFLTALGGLAFGVVESLIYVNLYFPDNGSDYVVFRFTVPVLMHVLSSFLVGLGLTRSVIDWAAGRAPLPAADRNYYAAGVLLHAMYNSRRSSSSSRASSGSESMGKATRSRAAPPRRCRGG